MLAAPVPPAPRASTRTMVLPGTAPKGATTQTLATPLATARGLPIGAEATKEAEGMSEAEAIRGERGRGNFMGGQPRRGWGRPWNRW